MESSGLLAIAVEAAIAASVLVRESSVSQRAAQEKAAGDYVTEIDTAAETCIRDRLAEQTGIPVVGEEAGGIRSERFWVVDPIDGTTNFTRGFPMVGISIALVVEGRP